MNSSIIGIHHLTFVFESGDDEVESIGLRTPGVGDVFESHEIGACVDGADGMACVSTRQVRLMQSSQKNKHKDDDDDDDPLFLFLL